MEMEEWMWLVWLGIAVISFIAEALTAAVVSIWFAAGAVVALILSLIPEVPFWVEIIVFVVVSVACFIAVRPLMTRYMKKRVIKSNVDALVGKRGVVLRACDDLNAGEITINGVTWTAAPALEGLSFSEGEIAEVAAVEGNKLLIGKTPKVQEK